MSKTLKRKRVSAGSSDLVNPGRETLPWEDVQGLLDGDQRPIAWAKCNVILSAHPTKPTISGRIKNPSQPLSPQQAKFILPSPEPIEMGRTAYSPATFICLSPQDDFVFAYFPSNRSSPTIGIEGDSRGNIMSRSEDGIGCVWQRETEVNVWTIVSWWSMPPGDGVVTGKWLGPEREWDSSLPSMAAGPRFFRRSQAGPSTIPSTCTLLLVLESNTVQLCMRPFGPIRHNFRFLRAPLSQPYESYDGTSDDLLAKTPARSMRVARASVGLFPSETSVFIASTSCLMPPLPPQPPLDLTVSLLDPSFDPTAPPPIAKERAPEIIGVEEMPRELIELVELRLDLLSAPPTISCSPLAPIYHTMPLTSHLAHLEFATLPPAKEPPPVPVEDSVFTPPESAIEQSPVSQTDPQRVGIGLLTSFVDNHHYDTPPTSTLRMYRLSLSAPQLSEAFTDADGASEKVTAATPERMDWAAILASKRTFDSHVVNFLVDPTGGRDGRLLVGMTNVAADSLSSGMKSRNSVGGSKSAKRGELRLLKSDTLADDLDTRPTLYTQSEMPLSAACSPNHMFIVVASGLHTAAVMATPPYPARVSDSPTASPALESLSSSLSLALLNSTDITDVARSLWNDNATKEDVCSILKATWEALDQLTISPEVGDDDPGSASAQTNANQPSEGPKVEGEDGKTPAKTPGKTPGKTPDAGVTPAATRSPKKAQEGDQESHWTYRFIELLLTVYRCCPDDTINATWKTCFDMTKLLACEKAFSSCRALKPPENTITFNTKDAWYLMRYTFWFLELCKRLVADAVVDRAWELWRDEEADGLDAGNDPGPSRSAILLLHPHTLRALITVLTNIHHFRDFMYRSTANTHVYLLQCTLQESLDRSFLDLTALATALRNVYGTFEIYADRSYSTQDSFRDALVSMSIPKSLLSMSRDIARLLTTRDKLGNRIALLISPADLFQSMAVEAPRETQKDVICETDLRSEPLKRMCLACGGIAEKHRSNMSSSWQVFEDTFMKHCICGGLWNTLH